MVLSGSLRKVAWWSSLAGLESAMERLGRGRRMVLRAS
jgi:hypothetical protein